MLIEVEKGLSINTAEIEAIQKKTELITIIFTAGKTYTVNIPYRALLDVVNKGDSDTKRLLDSYLKSVGTFAG